MKVGICGFSQSGKSTIFQALSPGGGGSRGGVVYGNIKVPDTRVDRLAAIFSPKKTTFAEITFMDAGGGRYDTGAFPPDVVQNMRNADVLVPPRGISRPTRRGVSVVHIFFIIWAILLSPKSSRK